MRWYYTILAVLVCSSFVGCSAMSKLPTLQNDEEQTEKIENPYKEASDRWRLESLEANFLELKDTQKKEILAAKKSKNILEKRMLSLEQQMAALHAELNSIRKQLGQEPASAQFQKTASVKLAGPESTEKKEWAKPPAATSKVATAQSRKPKTQPKSAQSVALTTHPRTAQVTGQNAEALKLYETGQELATQENAKDARATLDSFLTKYPNHKLVPNALYWKAETYYAQKDYTQAILAFKEVTHRFPRHDKAQAALLKIGMSYIRLADVDNAVFYLRALVDDFPNSPLIVKAKELLQNFSQ